MLRLFLLAKSTTIRKERWIYNEKEEKISLYIRGTGYPLGMIWISPFYLMIVNSFKDPRGIFSNVLTPPSELNFENYQQAFEDLEFVRSFFNSLLITVASVLVIIIFSSMAGYALARNKSKLSSVLLLLFVAAMLIPFQSVMIPLTSNFGQIGML